MLSIHVIAVGKVKESFIAQGLQEYSKRLLPYVRLTVTEVADVALPKKLTPSLEQALLKKEGERILKARMGSGPLVLLDLHGKPCSSEELAQMIQEYAISGAGTITFCIGGTLGIPENVRNAATHRISLSKMTFTHQMARLLLLEQIYRAAKINSGEQYHR